jgi:hypothetical protein
MKIITERNIYIYIYIYIYMYNVNVIIKKIQYEFYRIRSIWMNYLVHV